MAYNILSTSLERNDARRRILNSVNAEVGDEMAQSLSVFRQKFNRAIFPVRWSSSVADATVSSVGVVVNPGLSAADAKAAIIFALRKAKGGATPPAPKPAPVEPTPDPQVWFREEEGNLLHRESHAGLFPAEFYAVRSDGISLGLTADGACNA